MNKKISNLECAQGSLDVALEEIQKGENLQKAIAVSKIISVKFRGYRDQLKYKELTSKVIKMEFYED